MTAKRLGAVGEERLFGPEHPIIEKEHDVEKKVKGLLRKKDTSFGSAYYDRTSLPLPVEGRTGLSVHLSFEEGLKLQLSLQQALWELNRLDRRSPRSLSKGVALTMFPHQNRIMVNMGTLKHRRMRNAPEDRKA